MRKKEIKTIQQYFDILYKHIEALFERQKLKLIFNTGYNLFAFLIKTHYRMKNLGLSLKKIIKITEHDELISYLKKKDKELENFVLEKIVNEESKGSINFYIEDILCQHCGSILDGLEVQEILDFSEIESILISALHDNIMEYDSIIENLRKKKYGKTVLYKEKVITKRLKRKKWKKI